MELHVENDWDTFTFYDIWYSVNSVHGCMSCCLTFHLFIYSNFINFLLLCDKLD